MTKYLLIHHTVYSCLNILSHTMIGYKLKYMNVLTRQTIQKVNKIETKKIYVCYLLYYHTLYAPLMLIGEVR